MSSHRLDVWQRLQLWWTACFLACVTLATGARAEDGQPSIQLKGDWSQEWKSSEGNIAMLRGKVEIIQGSNIYTADRAVVWSAARKGSAFQKLTIYLEDHVNVLQNDRTSSQSPQLIEVETSNGVTLSVRGRDENHAGDEDPFYRRALVRKMGAGRQEIQPTQWRVEQRSLPAGPVFGAPGSVGGMRRILISPRSQSIPFSIQSSQSTETSPPEQITQITGGVNMVVSGYGPYGMIDLSADRMVIWSTNAGEDFSSETMLSPDSRYQVYLEGNIVIRQGERQPRFQTNFLEAGEKVIRAERAFYDISDERGLVINAELRASVPNGDGSVRIRADRLRQLSHDSFHAQNAWFTTSQYGQPGYRFQASDVFLEQRDWMTLSGSTPRYDPTTGAQLPSRITWLTSLNNTLLIDEFPVFFAPQLSSPAEDPGIPIDGLSFRQDRVFGTQVLTHWNLYRIFGIDAAPGSRWGLQADYLSQRGPNVGMDGRYFGVDSLGNPFKVEGLGVFQSDQGFDNLGLDRRHLDPDSNLRGRLNVRHQHDLGNNLKVQTEISYSSDRNYREQYYEQIFDTQKDDETMAYLRQNGEMIGWNGLFRTQLNNFENNTQWLPRGDLFTLGVPLFDGWLNWSSHSSAGYAQLSRANAPKNAADLYSPIPYIVDAQGGVMMTRHELQAPIPLGAMKIVPYLLGEAAYWGDSFSGNSVDRFYAKAGVRTSLEAMGSAPEIQSDILNLNGLTHRILLEADYGWSDATRDISQIPQWNEIDDDSQERFRQRFLLNTFGGVLPAAFDPRSYAIRTGAGSWTTSSFHELVADQQVLRVGLSQRWQTKVGPPDRLRVKDWISLDLGASYFPDAQRDNFGEEFGLVNSRFVWAVGDRTSIVASSLHDLFSGGQQLWNVGVLSQRTERGSVYVGLRQIKGGPLNSQILTASYSYVLSPKWITTMSTAYDIHEHRDAGQSMTFSRVGEWLIFHFGTNVDISRNNVGFSLSVEPRFGNPYQRVNPQYGTLMNTY